LGVNGVPARAENVTDIGSNSCPLHKHPAVVDGPKLVLQNKIVQQRTRLRPAVDSQLSFPRSGGRVRLGDHAALAAVL
jgi:hypothetical protein